MLAEGRAPIKGTGVDAERQVSKYVTPFLPGGEQHDKQGSHALIGNHGEFAEGEKVVLHGHKTETTLGGRTVHHVQVARPGSKKKTWIPVSKLQKPGAAPTNKGFQNENAFVDYLKKHKLMDPNEEGAGSTGGTDFTVINKKAKTKHKGRATSEERFAGETKADTTAAFGQLTVNYHPDKGWHISDKARALRPQYAAAIEKAGILDHLNNTQDPTKHDIPTTASGRTKTVQLDHPDLKPAEAYLKDHHVHLLHVGGGYGTYRVGAKDVTGHGFDRMSGEGRWTIREKQAGNKTSRTIAFSPKGVNGLKKSRHNLENEADINAFKKTLGHA